MTTSTVYSTTRAEPRNPLLTSPYRWSAVPKFALAFLALTAAYVAVGFTVVGLLEPTRVGEAEVHLSEWFEQQRTEDRNDLAIVGSYPSDTVNKVAIMAVLAVAFAVVFRRWHEWAFLASALLLEVSVYGLTNLVVGRARPPVERLAHAPTDSWPSGHMAAAVTLYLGFVIVARWRTRDRRLLVPVYAVAALVPLGMAASRIYLGMHYLSDIIGGALLGVLCLLACRWILQRSVAELAAERREGADLPAHVTRLDLSEDTESDRSRDPVATADR